MALVKSLGAIILSVVLSFLIYLLFYFATPWLMSFGWGGFAVWFCIGNTIVGFLIWILNFVSAPIYSMVKGLKVPATICSVILAGFGIYTMLLPWFLDMDYLTVNKLMGINISIDIIGIFAIMAIVAYKQGAES